MKSIILCADDYAQNKAVSRGIIALIRNQRISATSCMTTSKLWPEHAKWLLPHVGAVDIGLHFNLTEGYALGKTQTVTQPATDNLQLPALKLLLWRSQWRTLSFVAVKNELMRQLDQFHAQMGMLPDYIDGHQHIHQFPVIREALLEVYLQHFRNTPLYIRSTYPMHAITGGKLKSWAIVATGARGLESRLNALNIPHNTSFSGSYPFAAAARYPELFPEFLQGVESGGLIMCHPGLEGADYQDPLAKSRYIEYKHLTSERYDQQCAEAEVKVGRFSSLEF